MTHIPLNPNRLYEISCSGTTVLQDWWRRGRGGMLDEDEADPPSAHSLASPAACFLTLSPTFDF